MIETILIFTSVILLMLAAQHSAKHRWLRWLTLIALLLLGVAVAGIGLLLWRTPQQVAGILSPEHYTSMVVVFLLVSLIILLPTSLAARAWLRGQSPVLQGVFWTEPPFLASWTLMTLFIGGNFAMTAIAEPETISLDKPLQLLFVQDLSFVALAMVGVGWGSHRHWPQVARRLGIRPLRITDLLVGGVMALAMLVATALISGILMLIFGQELTDASSFNQQIIQQLPGIGGILLMGLLTGVGEEFLFRGALQPVLGIWLTSFLFALSHIQYLNPAILVIFVLGLFLGYSRNKWGLLTAVWTHAVYNSLVALLVLAAMQLS